MKRLLKVLFFALLVKPVVTLLLGLNIVGRARLPQCGPAVIVANHNSHLDTMVLMSLFPLRQIHRIRPVAAADYFLGNGGFMAWLSLNCIGIIPMDRQGGTKREELFQHCHAALDQGDILILFPEGSRGAPEKIGQLKKGIYHLLLDRKTDTPLIPVIMRGLGKALPRGEALLVPFNCDVVIGEPLAMTKNSEELLANIQSEFAELSKHCITNHADSD